MTKKAHRQREAIYAPRGPRNPRPWNKAERYDLPHRTVLDTGPEQLTPSRRTVDDRRNHPLRSELLQALLAAINARLADYAPVRLDEDGADVVGLFTAAGLNAREAKAWELKCSGFDIETIRVFMGVQLPAAANEPYRLSRKTVEEYLRCGRIKLRAWYAVNAR